MRSSEVDVVVIVEHLNRELEGALLLERALSKRDITSEIVFKGWDEGPASCRLRPKVVVTPWCYDDKDVEALCAYQGGFSDGTFDIVDLHSEQVTTPDGLSFVLPSGKAKEAFHICWGPFFHDALVGEGVGDDRICIAGSNRLDMFRDEYRGLSATKGELAKEYGLEESKPWVLFVGNYSAAFMTDERVAELEARGLANTNENRDVAKRAYDEALAWLEDALNDSTLAGAEFIYRPHPSEPFSEQLKAIDRRYGNLHVVKQRAIRDWFLNVKVALTWCSTSSVEAAYAGLPVFALRPFEVPKHLQFELLETIEQLKTSADMCAAIRKVLDGGLHGVNAAFAESLSRYYKKGGESATDNIANAIASLISEGEGRFSCKRTPLYHLRKNMGYFAKIAAYRLGIARKIPAWRILADDHISLQELERKRSQINGKC